jgi:hypothetical protein
MADKPLIDQHGNPITDPAVLVLVGVKMLTQGFRIATDAMKTLQETGPSQALAMMVVDEAARMFDIAMQLTPDEFKTVIRRKIDATFASERTATYRCMLRDGEDKLTGESVSFEMSYAEAVEKFGLPP